MTVFVRTNTMECFDVEYPTISDLMDVCTRQCPHRLSLKEGRGSCIINSHAVMAK